VRRHPVVVRHRRPTNPRRRNSGRSGSHARAIAELRNSNLEILSKLDQPSTKFKINRLDLWRERIARPTIIFGFLGYEMSSPNFFKSMLPPETMATIGPWPALPVNAAASGSAPAPSEMIRAFSAMIRIARFVSSRLTTT